MVVLQLDITFLTMYNIDSRKHLLPFFQFIPRHPVPAGCPLFLYGIYTVRVYNIKTYVLILCQNLCFADVEEIKNAEKM